MINIHTGDVLPAFPPQLQAFESPRIAQALTEAHRCLSELKGACQSIPNPKILIEHLCIREVQGSSAIEQIITSVDELHQQKLFSQDKIKPDYKEALRYKEALETGVLSMKNDFKGIITNRLLINMQETLLQKGRGFRTTPGTQLKNQDGEVVFTPPQDPQEIQDLMKNWERLANAEQPLGSDPLVAMALLHYQFETIHPFPDGNGRIGRLFNILFLIKEGLLTYEAPILYLSAYILQTKNNYYHLLQAVRQEEVWEEWVLYILRGVKTVAKNALEAVTGIREQMANVKQTLRQQYSKVYSQELLNHLFCFPYTHPTYMAKELGISRPTAFSYISVCRKADILKKLPPIHKRVYYLHKPLWQLMERLMRKDQLIET